MHQMHVTVPGMAIHDVHRSPRDATSLTPAEAMAALGISRSTLNRYVDAGVLEPRRLPSGHRRFDSQDVEAILARGETWEAEQ